MRVLFFGTSAFAARVLSFLIEQGIHEVVAIVTRPDRPKGRSLVLSPPPVKETAAQCAPQLPIHQPTKASTPEFAEILKKYRADVFVVVAYGEIIKQNILEIPEKGCINIHASLLPKYRGAAPMQRALMDGAKETGVTIIEMALQMDAGAIIEMAKTPIPSEMTLGELEERLYPLACTTLSDALEAIEKGGVKKISQDPSLVTFAPKITVEETKIDWDQSATSIHNLIRALSPNPGAWCFVEIGKEQKRLKILRSHIVDSLPSLPGILHPEGIVTCGTGAIKILFLQLEGKKPMPAATFFRGYPHVRFRK